MPASYHTVSFQVSLDVSTTALSLIPKSFLFTDLLGGGEPCDHFTFETLDQGYSSLAREIRVGAKLCRKVDLASQT